MTNMTNMVSRCRLPEGKEASLGWKGSKQGKSRMMAFKSHGSLSGVDLSTLQSVCSSDSIDSRVTGWRRKRVRKR